MTQHKMVTFQLHRNGVILVVIGAILFAVLLFAAGYLTAMARGAKLPTATPAIPKVAVPKVPTIAVPTIAVPKVEAPKVEAPKVAVPAIPPETLTLRVGVYATEEEAKAAMTAFAAQKPVLVAEKTSDETLLYTVRVGSYASRLDAMKAAAELRKQGISAAIVKE